MRLPQAIALVMALLIGVLLFLAPRTPLPESKDGEKGTFLAADSLLRSQIATLNENDQKMYTDISRVFGSDLHGKNDSLRGFWMGKKDLFAIGLVQISFASQTKDAQDWMIAGKDFYRAANIGDPNKKSLAYDLCVSACEEVLKKEPGNKEAKLRRAVCFVEKREDPMKGVMLLKELIKEDSTYIDAQLQLGFFSLQSNQLDKAAERFQKVLSIDSTYYDAWLYLAQTQEMAGEKGKAIENYEKYYGTVNDTLIRTELRKYIDKIKTTKTH